MSPVKSPSLNPLPLKQRMTVPRQHMPEQLAQIRATNFTEVNLGYSAELAKQEAVRCLECAKPACTDQCPVGVKVKEFVQLIVAGDFLAAAAKVREDNVLPAITGRRRPAPPVFPATVPGDNEEHERQRDRDRARRRAVAIRGQFTGDIGDIRDIGEYRRAERRVRPRLSTAVRRPAPRPVPRP